MGCKAVDVEGGYTAQSRLYRRFASFYNVPSTNLKSLKPLEGFEVIWTSIKTTPLRKQGRLLNNRLGIRHMAKKTEEKVCNFLRRLVLKRAICTDDLKAVY